MKDNPHTNNKSKQKIDYVIAGPSTEVDRETSAETMLKMQDEFSDVFTAVGCFKGTAYRSKMA